MGSDPTGELAARVAALRAGRDSAGLLALTRDPQAVQAWRPAIEALIALGDEAALDALGSWMAAPADRLSDLTLEALAAAPGANAARLLARGLGGTDPFWRNRVLEALARRSEPEVLALIAPALRDRSGAIRQLAQRHARKILREFPERVAALSAAKLAPVLETLEPRELLEWFRGPHVGLRAALAGRLGTLGGEEAVAALADAAGEASEAGEAALLALEGCSAAPAAAFRALSSHGSTAIRRRAVAAAGTRSGPDARAILEAALRDPDPQVRESALRSAACPFGPVDLPLLGPVLADSAPGVRAAAVALVARWPGAAVDDLLRRATRDDEETVRRMARASLVRRGVLDPEDVAALAERVRGIATQDKLPSGDLEEACAIVACFGKRPAIAAESGLEALVAAAGAPSLRLRRTATEALQGYPAELRAPALVRLVDTLDKNVLKAVGLGLGSLGVPEGVVPLIRILDECGGKAGEQAKELLGRYECLGQVDAQVGLLQQRWVSARRFAAERLRESGDQRAVAPLLAALEDEDIEVQLASVLALGRFASRAEVAAKLVAVVEYGDLSVRQAAIEALGEARVSEALPALIRALANPFLRTRAEAALKAIGDRKGHLAVRRRRLRDKHFKKKKPTPAERARAGSERRKSSRPRPRLGGE